MLISYAIIIQFWKKVSTLSEYYLNHRLYLSVISLSTTGPFSVPKSSPGSHIHFLFMSYVSVLPSVILSQSFLLFHNLTTFEEFWSDILENVPQFGVIWYFLKTRLSGQNDHWGNVPFLVYQYILLQVLLTSTTWVQWCLLGNLLLLFIMLNKYLGWGTLRLYKCHVSTWPLIYSFQCSMGLSCSGWYCDDPNGDFLFPSFILCY